MKRIVCVIGTRPEAIKMAPVILALRREQWADVSVIATAQHREMLDDVLQIFNIEPDEDLDIMQQNQSLPELTSRLLVGLNQSFARLDPDFVLAQGDTTTMFVAGLVSFYRSLGFGHIEAGLRTKDPYRPFPEEMNRTLAARLAMLHFAPTDSARQNLVDERIPKQSIFTTGNTVVDSLLEVVEKDIPTGLNIAKNKKLILVTAHRREAFGSPFGNLCRALRRIADQNPDVQIVYPVHPNPNVVSTVYGELEGHERITLCEPLSYGPFISLMNRAFLVLTDSGGIQEEAPCLAKPVLVFRSETERLEGIAEGVVKLVGTEAVRIVDEVNALLKDEERYRKMAKKTLAYGDGRAAQRIVTILRQHLVETPKLVDFG